MCVGRSCGNRGFGAERAIGHLLGEHYEENLANLIKDVREEFGVPELKVVIGVTGNWELGMEARGGLGEACGVSGDGDA